MILRLLYLSTALALVLGVPNKDRRVHRLIGGHFRIVNPYSDDAELLTAEASGSKSSKKTNSDDGGGDEKKTLSQQVADGKYGLIQKELFTKPVKKPGVISYYSNSEVPKDNINNLGGLTKDDIWLAENHLLVLKGGRFSEQDDKQDNSAPVWSPIDDYVAPKRPVKIPSHPKVPPPFPVQLSDDGPLQILGTNYTRTLNGTTLNSGPFALPPPEGYVPGTGPYFPPAYPYPSDSPPGRGPHPYAAKPSGEVEPGPPFSPQTILNGTALPPFFASLPPGAVAVPPPPPQDQIDEDDPSIYYPPPYSFFYPKDNSSRVPAGPLVPGIILPPPPNFFAPLDANRRPYSSKTTSHPVQQQIRPTTTPIPPTLPSKKPIQLPVHIPSEINNELKPLYTTTEEPQPKLITILPSKTYTFRPRLTARPNKQQSVTILKPVKTTTDSQKFYVYKNQNKPFEVYGPPQGRRTTTTTTEPPVKIYYSTQSNEIESNSVTSEKYYSRRPKLTTKRPFLIYEDEASTTLSPNKINNYFDIPKEYYVPAKPQQYIYVPNRYQTQKPRFRLIQNTPKAQDSYRLHISNLQNQINYFSTPRPSFRQVSSPRPVYQYSFQAANYQQQHDTFRPSQLDDGSSDEDKFRPMPKYSVQIQPAAPPQQQNSAVYYRQTTEATQVDNGVRSQAVSQYSFQQRQPNNYYAQQQIRDDGSGSDEMTNHYFNMFGQKLRQTQNQQQQPQPNKSLEKDTDVNYKTLSVTQNPHAEWIKPNQQTYLQLQQQQLEKQLDDYKNTRTQINPNLGLTKPKYVERPQNSQPQFVEIKPGYAKVNYVSKSPAQYIREETPKQNEPQIVKAIPVRLPTGEGQEGSFISYQLPGDEGAHFYFLTPQLAQRTDQGVGYFYTRPNPQREQKR